MNQQAMDKLVQDMEAELAAERECGLEGKQNPFKPQDNTAKDLVVSFLC